MSGVRIVTLLATLWVATAASSPAWAEGEPDPDPDRGVARPDAEDLRGGHVLISAAGGLWVPSSGLVPRLPGLGNLDVGATARGGLGLGVGRYLVLRLDGGFGYVPASGSVCDGCSATSIEGGLTALFHPTQGFAMDPWAGFGVAYRHTLVSYEDAGNPDFGAVDFMRLSIGADYFPLASLGFGPYLETDVGLRTSDAVSYATFQLGMRLVWDPIRTGTSFTPGVAMR